MKQYVSECWEQLGAEGQGPHHDSHSLPELGA
jgi:hypothetical protein